MGPRWHEAWHYIRMRVGGNGLGWTVQMVQQGAYNPYMQAQVCALSWVGRGMSKRGVPGRRAVDVGGGGWVVWWDAVGSDAVSGSVGDRGWPWVCGDVASVSVGAWVCSSVVW